MTNKEAIEIIKAYKDRLTSSCSNQLDEDICAFDLAIKALEDRQTGHWIKDCDSCDCSNCYNSELRFTRKDCSGRCSNCGELQCCTDNFCPNCGADMRKGEEE